MNVTFVAFVFSVSFGMAYDFIDSVGNDVDVVSDSEVLENSEKDLDLGQKISGQGSEGRGYKCEPNSLGWCAQNRLSPEGLGTAVVTVTHA